MKKNDYGPQAKDIRVGEYPDSLEGYVTSDLNYRREHFKYSTYPLTFDAQGQPVLFKGLSIWEFTKYISDDIHSINKLMFANSVPNRFTYTTDALMLWELKLTDLWEGKFNYETDSIMSLRRT